MTKTGPDPLHPTTRIERLIVITLAVIEDVLARDVIARRRLARASHAASPSTTLPIGQLVLALCRAMSSHPNSHGEFSSRLSGEEKTQSPFKARAGVMRTGGTLTPSHAWA
jgi:hypothetical protein